MPNYYRHDFRPHEFSPNMRYFLVISQDFLKLKGKYYLVTPIYQSEIISLVLGHFMAFGLICRTPTCVRYLLEGSL